MGFCMSFCILYTCNVIFSLIFWVSSLLLALQSSNEYKQLSEKENLKSQTHIHSHNLMQTTKAYKL